MRWMKKSPNRVVDASQLLPRPGVNAPQTDYLSCMWYSYNLQDARVGQIVTSLHQKLDCARSAHHHAVVSIDQCLLTLQFGGGQWA